LCVLLAYQRRRSILPWRHEAFMQFPFMKEMVLYGVPVLVFRGSIRLKVSWLSVVWSSKGANILNEILARTTKYQRNPCEIN